MNCGAEKTRMNTSIESIERNLCKTLMEKLPFPAKETFLVAYNRGWGNRYEIDETNPFAGLLLMKWKLEKDNEKWGELEGVYSRKHNKAEGTPPPVERENEELESQIADIKHSIKAVLREEDQGIVEDIALRIFFNAVREVDQGLRQIQQTLEWNATKFRIQRTERLGRMVAKWREGREAPSSKLDGTHANEKGGEK